MRSLLSSWLKLLMLLVRRMTFLKENGESALGQGSRSLGGMEPGVLCGAGAKGCWGARGGSVGRARQGKPWS